MKLSALLSGLVFVALQHVNATTNVVVIKNYKFYDSITGKYFGVKGVDYYPRPNTGEMDVNNFDFFTDDHADIWGPDIENLAELGANAVRLYAVDPSKSHDKFMCALRSHGMYALVDFGASCTGCAITTDKYPTCYPPTLKTRGEMIIDAFAKYDNVLAFSAGNEINQEVATITDNAPCQKKFLRDMRAYIGRCSTLRTIPIGVVLSDRGQQRDLNAKYYNCRSNANDTFENAEWYGLNVYQFCDGALTDSSPVGPGYQQLLSDFSSYAMNIPVMFTEFGCLNPSFPKVGDYNAQRTWLQAGWIHNKDFRKQFSGGFAFEYSTENANSQSTSTYPFTAYGAQNYGLGYFSPATCDHKSTPCVYNPMPNYKNLAIKYNGTDYSDEPVMSAFTPDAEKVDIPACPSTFPALSTIDWSTVDAVTTSCPATLQSYTCPGQDAAGNWTKPITNTTDPPTTAPKPTTTTTTTPTPSPSSTKKSSATSLVQNTIVTLLVTGVASTMLAAFL